MTRNIIITGFMCSGKSTLGRAVAAKFGKKFVDTDAEIERRQSLSVSEIFAKFGEAYFRNLENRLCHEMLTWHDTVVATGGGMPLNPQNRRLLNSAGIVFNLKSGPAEILNRAGNLASRPLLDCENPSERIQDLLQQREGAYSSFPFQLNTTAPDIDQLAGLMGETAERMEDFEVLSVNVPQDGGYSIIIGPEALNLIAPAILNRGFASSAALVSDSNVSHFYSRPVAESISKAGFQPCRICVPAGEESKNLRLVGKLYRGIPHLQIG